MASLTNPSGVINVGGLTAASANPTTGTIPRAREPGLDLSDAAQAVGNVVGAVVKEQVAAKKKAEDKAAADAALQQEVTAFEVRAGSPQDVVSRLAQQSRDTTGLDMPEKVKTRLTAMNAEFQRLAGMFEQIPEKDRERRINAAMRLQRIRFLMDHPEYGLEALVASGRLDKLEAGSEFADEEALRQRTKDADTALRKFYQDRGYNVDPRLSLEDLSADYQSRFAPEQQIFFADEQRLKRLEQRRDLSNTQKDIAREELLDKLGPSYIKGTGQFIVSQINSAANPQDRIAQLEAFRLNLLNKAGEYGLTDPAEIEKRFGVQFKLLDQAKEVITNNKGGEALVAAVRFQEAAAEQIVMNKLGPGYVALKVLAPFAQYAGPSMETEVFTPAPPGQPEKFGNKVRDLFAQTLAAPVGQANDPFSPLTDHVESTDSPDSAKLRAGEKAVATINQIIVDHFKDLPPEAQAKAIDQWEATIMSPYSAKSGTAWADIMDAMDSPNFDEALAAVNKKPEVGAVAVRNSRSYVKALLSHMGNLSAPEGTLTWDEKRQEFGADPIKLSVLTASQRNEYVLAVRRLSQAARVLRTRLNQRADDPNPLRLLQEIWVEAGQ